MFHWNKIKALRRGVKQEKKYKVFAEEINSTIKTKTQGHNMVLGIVILTSLEIAFSTLLGERQ